MLQTHPLLILQALLSFLSHTVQAELPQDAVEMYTKVDRWEDAYRIAVGCMPKEEIRQLYVSRAGEMEEEGKLREAEKLYVIVEEPDLAISMYKKHKQVSV